MHEWRPEERDSREEVEERGIGCTRHLRSDKEEEENKSFDKSNLRYYNYKKFSHFFLFNAMLRKEKDVKTKKLMQLKKKKRNLLSCW